MRRWCSGRYINSRKFGRISIASLQWAPETKICIPVSLNLSRESVTLSRGIMPLVWRATIVISKFGCSIHWTRLLCLETPVVVYCVALTNLCTVWDSSEICDVTKLTIQQMRMRVLVGVLCSQQDKRFKMAEKHSCECFPMPWMRAFRRYHVYLELS